MIILTNDFHGTHIALKANVGDAVSKSTLRRAAKRLCGLEDCVCGAEDGSRNSRFILQRQGGEPESAILVVDTRSL